MKRSLKKIFYANKTKFITFLIVIGFFLVSSLIFMISLIRLKGIENTIRVAVLLLIFLYLLFYVCKGYEYIKNRNKVKYIIISLISVLISIISLVLSYYINMVYGTINSISNNNTSYYTGYLISLKDNDHIKEVGIINNSDDIEGYVLAKEIIDDKKLDIELRSYDTYEDMIDDLYNKVIDGAFVQSNYVSYFSSEEDYKNILNDTKIVYQKSTTKEDKVNTSSNNKLDRPFTILLMGVDSTENTIETANSFNGDTLMLVTFNPHTLNAIMFSIPRDLYVPIACRKGSEAKINTSSVGGIDCVKDTIKDLLDIDIDYYARINFKGVVDLVDALKGIDVLVTYPFCEQDSNRSFAHKICLKAGYQHLNGEQTLAYARHRHTLPTGDLQRIQNQQLIVEAMAKKLLSLTTITEFKNILASVSNNVTTNLSVNEILSSYDILKKMILKVIAKEEPLVVNKAYLEVYDRRIYNAKRGTYTSALGYYETSLDDIIKALKVNLELESPELIKEFSFDANTSYEQILIGKGLKNDVDERTIPNFIGKSVSVAEEWGKSNNITITKVMVDSSNPNYNANVGIGLIGNQSIKAGTSLTNVKSLTIYINISSESEDNVPDNNLLLEEEEVPDDTPPLEDDLNNEENDNLEDDLNDLFDVN